MNTLIFKYRNYLLFVFYFLLAYCLLYKFSYISFNKNDFFFDADTLEVYKNSRELVYTMDLVKHPLFYAITIPLTKTVDILTADYKISSLLIFSFYTSLYWYTSKSLFLKLFDNKYPFLNYLIPFLISSSLYLGIMPETYSFSGIFTNISFLFFIKSIKEKKYSFFTNKILWIAILAASLSNLTCLSLIILGLSLEIYYFNKDLKKLLINVLKNSILFIFLFSLPFFLMYFLKNFNLFKATFNYVPNFSDPYNFFELKNYFLVFNNFIVSSIIYPFNKFQNKVFSLEIYYQSKKFLMAIFLYLITTVIIIKNNLNRTILYFRKNKTDSILFININMILIIIINFFFYIYFAPESAFLFALPYAVLPICLIFFSFKEVFKEYTLWLIVFVLSAFNISPLFVNY